MRVRAAPARSRAHPAWLCGKSTGLALASIVARRGKAGEAAAFLHASYGIAPPDGPRRVEKNGVALIGIGREQWFATAAPARAAGFVADLAARLAGKAAVADHSDGRLMLRLAGPRVRAVLAKGVPIDLHPRAFKPGDAAQTQVAHIGVLIAQIDDAPTYELLAARSFTGSLWSWLEASALEFGLEIAGDG